MGEECRWSNNKSICIYICGAKGSGCPDPFQILSPKDQAEDENVRG